MSPKQRKKNCNWPKYVYEANGRIVYRPRIPTRKGLIETDKNGFLKPPVRLGRLGDSDDKIIRAYMAAKYSIENISEPDKYTLFWLKEKYCSSSRFRKLTPTTQKDYEGLLERFLSHRVLINGQQAKLGDLKGVRLTKPLLRKVMDKRLVQYQKEGKSGASTVNRQFSAFSALLTYGIQYHEGLGLEANPCFGIERHKEHKRERYVSDEEYQVQLEAANRYAPAYLAVVFEHAYLLATRSIEVADLKLSDITEKGYLVRRRKGSKDNLILWSDRLREAHRRACELRKDRKVVSIYLIPSMAGRKLTKNTLQSAMRNLKKKMEQEGIEHNFWTLHDLKRKSISDATDKDIGGHRSPQIRENYNVALESFQPPR